MRTLITITLGLLMLSYPLVSTAEVENFYHTKERLTQYYESGEYTKDISSVTIKAEAALRQAIIEKKDNEQLAIAMDIDETALSNAPLIFAAFSLPFQVGDSVPMTELQQFNQPYNALAIKPVFQLYQLAINNNVAVFFISARKPEGQQKTEENLRKAGYTQWNKVILLSPNDVSLPSEHFKTRSRKEITSAGYKIVVTIGDQKSDVIGPNTGSAFLLPNPFYFTP